mgnify:CR=1 FL=1
MNVINIHVQEVENKDGSITLEKVAKKDYYDISKEIFETKEREAYEAMLPETTAAFPI